MAHGKKLGLFFGNSAFSIVESQPGSLGKVVRVPYGAASVVDGASPLPQSEDAKFVDTLRKSLRDNNITSTDVHLALPSKDIVIRSFVIPMLKSNEIRTVVEFEIKKYIPFNLKDLSYSFHAAPFTEDKIKRMRVHFVAIRKEILERYKVLLKQAGLNVVFSEPAPMCLARALILKKYIKPEQKVAVLQTDYNDPGILIVDHGIVQFVRDFQLQNTAMNAAPLDTELLKKKLFNEIKISLDFYMRQFKSEKIEEVLTLSFDHTDDISAQLQQEIEVAVKKVDPKTLIQSNSGVDAGLVSAYGAVLSAGPKAVEFNLSGTITTVKQSKFQESIPEEYFPVIKTAIVSVALIFIVSFLTAFNTTQVKKRYNTLMEEQGAFMDMPLEDINKKVAENRSRLQTFKNFFKRSDAALVMVNIARILPEGVWLTDVTMRYGAIPVQAAPVSKKADPKADFEGNGIGVELSGYVFASDSNQQFKRVYSLVGALKSDKVLSQYFRNVNLTAIQSEEKEEVTVTSFKISCK